MASLFERLRTIALTRQSSPYEKEKITIGRAHSLLLPEKPNRLIQASEDKSETPQCREENSKILSSRLSKRGISRQLLANHPKSTRENRSGRPRILRGLSTTTKLDTCFIKTVDDFAVNSRSDVLPLFLSRQLASLSRPDSSENMFRRGSYSSSEESSPPSSPKLGIGPAPCFLVGQSTDEERTDADRAVQQHLKYYLPSSNRSLDIYTKEQLDAGSLVSSSSVRRNGSYIIESCRIENIEDEERVCSDNSQPFSNEAVNLMLPSTSINSHENVNAPKPRGTNIDEVEESIPPNQIGKVKLMNPYNDDKLNTEVWSDNEVIVLSYGDEKQDSLSQAQDPDALIRNSPSHVPFLPMSTPRIPEGDEVSSFKLGRFDTHESYKSAPVYSENGSDTESAQDEYMQYMLSLFDNPEWVQAEDLCPISSLGSLGRGAGGGVTGVFHIPTCMIYALKATSQWSEIDTFVILKEALGDQRTPQLMNLYGLFEDINSNEKALILEYMDLGSLHDHFLSKGKRCTEKQVRHIARETLLGLQQLHGFETPIIHRDIKPHNILIESGGSIRVGDYGLLYSLRDKKQWCTDMAGTSKYFSPERHNGKFSVPSDIWALGVTLLECFLGKVLDPKDLEDVKVAGGQVHPLELHDECEIRLSAEALDFLRCCLFSSPSKRWDANMLLQHPFLQPPYPDKKDIFVSKRKIAANEGLLKEILEIIQNFIRLNMEGEVSQKDIWANAKGITHEKRLSNIVRWTGFTKAQIEEYVMHLYNERTHPRSRF